MPRGRTALAVLLTAVSAALASYWVYQVDKALCNGCGNCIPWCPEGAISMVGPDAWIDPEICTGCGDCVYHCPRGAIFKVWMSAPGVEVPPGSPSVSPNPFRGVVTVEGLDQGSEVTLSDVTGRLVLREVSGGSSLQISLDGCSPGLLILAVDGSPAAALTLLP